jgi:hypothetical protein
MQLRAAAEIETKSEGKKKKGAYRSMSALSSEIGWTLADQL